MRLSTLGKLATTEDTEDVSSVVERCL